VVLVFEVHGDLAMFRKPYTTTSMVSFPFPPPTAIAGIIGAITGIEHGADVQAQNANFWFQMKGMQVAVGLRKPVNWMITAVNLMKFKTSSADMGEHIQVKHQFVKKPCYKVYVRGGELYNRLKKRLEKDEFVFTPYLGVAYAIADIYYLGEYPENNDIIDDKVALDTVVPYYPGMELDIIASGSVHRETVPFRMGADRKLQETSLVFYPEYCSSMVKKPQLILQKKGKIMISEVNGEKVAWFDEW
jgi:CRISPR-associated protein Cas5h